ncbi:hypothetical protein AB0H34_40540 [Saccharopolyspora shandongensis]|uniref:hypothetical protein n=1 Tax=Saccharopolyspora shandongensis TaxID=418495 RepID=UPI0033DC2729
MFNLVSRTRRRAVAGTEQRIRRQSLLAVAQTLEVTKRGHVVVVPFEETGIALAHNTVLSIPHTLDTVVPLIAEKLG